MGGGGIASEVPIKGSRHLKITGTPPPHPPPPPAPPRHWARSGPNVFARCPALSGEPARASGRLTSLPPSPRVAARLPSVCWLQGGSWALQGGREDGNWGRGEPPDLSSRGQISPSPWVPQRGWPSRPPAPFPKGWQREMGGLGAAASERAPQKRGPGAGPQVHRAEEARPGRLAEGTAWTDGGLAGSRPVAWGAGVGRGPGERPREVRVQQRHGPRARWWRLSGRL